MKTAIIFASKYGATEKCAKILSEKIPNSTTIDIRVDKMPDIAGYDVVIVGTAIYVGKPNKKILKFLEINDNLLKSKKLGLFMVCMEKGNAIEKQFQLTYSKELREKAIAKGYFGGSFNFEKMNFFERLVIRLTVKIKKSVDRLDYAAIDTFAENFS